MKSTMIFLYSFHFIVDLREVDWLSHCIYYIKSGSVVVGGPRHSRVISMTPNRATVNVWARPARTSPADYYSISPNLRPPPTSMTSWSRSSTNNVHSQLELTALRPRSPRRSCWIYLPSAK